MTFFPLKSHFGFGSFFREHHSKLMFHLKNLFIFLSFTIKCLGKNRKKIQKPPKRLSPLNKAKGWHYRNETFAELMETTAPVGALQEEPSMASAEGHPKTRLGAPWESLGQEVFS